MSGLFWRNLFAIVMLREECSTNGQVQGYIEGLIEWSTWVRIIIMFRSRPQVLIKVCCEIVPAIKCPAHFLHFPFELNIMKAFTQVRDLDIPSALFRVLGPINWLDATIVYG